MPSDVPVFRVCMDRGDLQSLNLSRNFSYNNEISIFIFYLIESVEHSHQGDVNCFRKKLDNRKASASN